MTLYELLHKDIQRMLTGIDRRGKGNIHPLILHEIEKYIIQIVFEETNYNYVVAARMLGIGRSTLYRKMDTYKLHKRPE